MRRFRLFWMLVPLLVLLAQHGALLHELSHLQHAPIASGSSVGGETESQGGSQCATCQAFSQVSHAAAASFPQFIAQPAPQLRSVERDYTVADAATPTPRSRGPPQV